MPTTKRAKNWLWIGIAVLAFVFYDLFLGWWSRIPPKRPFGVSPDAVFLFGLPVGSPFPIPKRGDWVNCWLDREHNVNWCRIAFADGALVYEGPFLRNEGSGAVLENALQIVVKATDNIPEWVYFQERAVPLVHLRDGAILIPAEAYEAGEKRLEWVREHQRP